MNRHFLIRRTVGRLALRAAGWRTTGSLPDKGILVGAPHTSNWDWVATLLMSWTNDVQPQILIKKEFFTGPFGPLLRATGGVPLDRENPGRTIRELLEQAKGDEPFLLVLAAEGTRSRGEFWKSGFYRLSQQTGLPITLASVDGPTKTIDAGTVIVPTGDVVADMDLVRAYYADKRGINPELRTEPRLREERDPD